MKANINTADVYWDPAAKRVLMCERLEAGLLLGQLTRVIPLIEIKYHRRQQQFKIEKHEKKVILYYWLHYL